MIEPIMFVGIGFLVAGLLVIGVIPLVHARAVRLTQRRLEALTPLSMAEIQADKDQLRAEFAMSTRRLEMSVEQMKAKTSSQLAEIGKKSEAIGRLKFELSEKTASLFAAEAKEKQLADELALYRTDTEIKSTALEDAERALAATQAELAQATANFNEASVTADSQRVELVMLRAQAEALKGQIESYEKETKELHGRASRQTAEIDRLGQQLSEERNKAETLGNRVGELDRLLIAQTTEAEILGRRVQELVARLDEQGRFLADREYVSDRLRTEAASAQKTEADVRSELAEAERRHRLATESIRTEKTLLEEQLKQSQDERAKLQREMATMKRDAETAWASERMESAVLRERINDVAAEVARLTATLEGPGSPIDTILAADAARPAAVGNGANGGAPSIAPNGGDSKGTLADRIRALQSRASRVPQASGA
jgi:DNA repair exonuclease SbcCD ATPase subunit